MNTEQQRLFARVMPEPNSGCWLFDGAWNYKGYGRMLVAGVHHNAHRVFFKAFNGAIPDAHVIDHLCRVRACCNPDHLEAVTVKENTRRGLSNKTHCPHGHEYTPENTRLEKRGNTVSKICKECARLKQRAERHRFASPKRHRFA